MYIYGRNVAKEILKNKQFLTKVKKVYLQEQILEDSFQKAFEFSKIPVKILKKSEMSHLVNGVHQGIIMEIDAYPYATLEQVLKTANFVVLLDHIEDPHNLGAIVRTSAAASVDAVIFPKDRSVSMNATAIKTSAASFLNIDIVQVVNLNSTIQTLKKNGFWIVGTDMEGEDYRTIDYQGKIALVIGNEGKGLSSLVKKNCDFIASIPISPKVESLNASVAAGLFIYEVVRKRK